MTKNQEKTQTVERDLQVISKKELRFIMCFKITMINMLEEVKDKCENFDMLLEILKMKSTIAKIKNSVDDLNI